LTAGQERGVEDALEAARTRYLEEGVITDEEWSLYMETIGG
jgi:hypothetical protein